MTKINLTYSTEMMTNYLQSELISPQAKFEALQTSNGYSLLFSVGTDGVFYLTQEESGTTATGWSKINLSSSQIRKDFSGVAGVTCRTFDAGQSVQDGSLGLAMVLNTSAGDHLYLSLGNSNKDTSWAGSPNWVPYEYDGSSTMSKLEIVNVFFCETSYQKQYIVVDIVRDPDSTEKIVSRFYIDPTKANGHYWNNHDLPVDIDVENYKSCIGRLPKGRVDGLYTAGHVADSAQLEFSPVINVWGDGPPLPNNLYLPGGNVPSAIAATRNTDLSTNLFVVSGSTLYYFDSSNQKNGAIAAALTTNDVFSGTSKLFAMSHNGTITLWGQNASDEVYYTSCQQSQVSNPSAWSIPVPILSDIEEISPYMNGVDGGNTIFASGGGKLWRITQASDSTSKLWQTNQITLPVPPTSKSISFNSYTTTIVVTDEQDQPLTNTSLSLSANNRCTVYINGLYYVIDRSPIHIKTNLMGSITIIESTGTLNGTTFTLSTGSGSTVTINPMDKPFKKLAALDTSDKLKAATINDGNSKTKSLVASGTSDNDLKTVAAAMGSLSKSYDKVSAPQVNAPVGIAAVAVAPAPAAVMDIGNDIVVAAGDLFKWLESGVEAIIQVIEDEATEVWHFIATIAGKVYRAVLDTVEAVVGAVEWVFNAVKTAIKDIIKFVEFLFEWDDIKRTKNVLHNLTKLFLNHQVDEIQEVKREFDKMITSAKQAVNGWAGISDLPGLGSEGTATVNSKSTPSAGQSSPSSLLSYHFQNNAQNATFTSPSATSEPPSNPIDVLIQALEKEGDTLGDALLSLQALAEKAPTMSVVDLFKAVIGIVADVVLESAQNVIDALFDIVYDLAKAALKLFDTPIHIPVLSDILSDIGIPEFSFLDVVCWVVAVPVTIGYKIVHNAAPFSDNSETSFLINVTDFQSLVSAFSESTPLVMSSVPASNPSNPVPPISSTYSGPTPLAMASPMLDPANPIPPISSIYSGPTPLAMEASMSGASDLSGVSPSASAEGPIGLSPAISSAVFVLGHGVSARCGFLSAVLDSAEAAEETGENPFAIPSAAAAIVGACGQGLANLLVPFDPIQQTAVQWVNRGTVAVRLLAKIIFSGPAQSYFAGKPKLKGLSVADGRGVGAIVDGVLVIPALFCSCWHFYELSEKPAGRSRSIAIVDETSNVVSDLARLGYTVAVNSEAEVKVAAIVVMAAADVVCGGLQIAVSMI